MGDLAQSIKNLAVLVVFLCCFCFLLLWLFLFPPIEISNIYDLLVFLKKIYDICDYKVQDSSCCIVNKMRWVRIDSGAVLVLSTREFLPYCFIVCYIEIVLLIFLPSGDVAIRKLAPKWIQSPN